MRVRVLPKSNAEGDLSGRRMLENLMERAEELADSINEFAARMTERIGVDHAEHRTDWRMSETKITFGVDLEAEAGVIVSRATAGASFDVEITWGRTA